MKNKLPDLLAWFRLLSSPVLLFLILQDGSEQGLMLFPAILAFIAAWTDYFDGFLARKWDISTKLGAFLDTICLLYTSPSPRDYAASRMPSSA